MRVGMVKKGEDCLRLKQKDRREREEGKTKKKRRKKGILVLCLVAEKV